MISPGKRRPSAGLANDRLVGFARTSDDGLVRPLGLRCRGTGLDEFRGGPMHGCLNHVNLPQK